MSINSRQKGARGERLVAQELYRELGINFSRNLEQYRTSGHGDLIADNPNFPFICEVKFHASGTECRPAWIAQVFKAASGTGLHPAIIYKFNRHPIRVRIWFDAMAEAFGSHLVSGEWLETDIQGFAFVCREIMARRAR